MIKNRWNNSDLKKYYKNFKGLEKNFIERIYSSHLIGSDKNLVMHGGGNISFKTTEKDIFKMHNLKTAKLFEFCMLAPLILSDKNTPLKEKEYRKYGKNFGLIFQATDDLLDYEGTKSIMGKNTQKDSKKNKGSILKYKNSKEVKLYCKKLAAANQVSN